MLCTANVSVPGLLGFGADLTSVIVPETSEPAGMETRPAASCTSVTTLAVNVAPGFALRELMVDVVAMENCRNASNVRVALAAGALEVSFFATSAAWLDGWQAVRARRLSPVATMVQYFEFIMLLRCLGANSRTRYSRAGF